MEKEDTTMRMSAIPVTSSYQAMKMDGKAKPFGAQFATRLDGVNSKLVCALSAKNTCYDDACGGAPICERPG
jgi:hypothetical protein